MALPSHHQGRQVSDLADPSPPNKLYPELRSQRLLGGFMYFDSI